MATGQVLLGRHRLPLLPLLHVRLLPWHLWRRLFSFVSTSSLSGILKPFRYTEIQKHTFHLKSKDDNKDRQARIPIQIWWVLCCSGACDATGLLQQTGEADQVLDHHSPPIIARQVQPEEVHGTAVPGKGREFPPRNILSLPQLVRCFRYKDLYDNVLFNYQVSKHSLLIFINSSQWLYNKMCALPLPEVISITCPYTFDTGYWIYESK